MIAIFNRQRGKKINSRLLKEIASAILTELEIADAEMEINLVGAMEMAALNKTFLQHEGLTDVITFDYSVGQASSLSHAKLKKKMDRQDACPTLRGEIFICVDEAIVHAKQFETNWQSEIVRYIIHGILHLLGYDDSRADFRRKMKRAENSLLRSVSKKFSFAQIARRR
jgi:probable rRNA maturation factor